MKTIYLTRSRYVAGLQCLRRLWLNANAPPSWSPPEPGSLQAIGSYVGRLAQGLFPGGALVEEPPWQHAEAMVRTAQLLADQTVPAIFEGAFEANNVRIRADVLERQTDGSWALFEVKSGSRIKDHYRDDLALQALVLEQSHVAISSASILHPNTDYVLDESGMDLQQLFKSTDLLPDVEGWPPGIVDRLNEQFSALEAPMAPEVDPGDHCHAPMTCEYWEACTAVKPTDWLFHLPHLRAKQREELAAMGIETIHEIPDDYALTQRQTVIRDVTRSGVPFVAPTLLQDLRRFGPPALYLDFEAFAPVIPLYAGARPYETIPFQWSLHCLDGDGELTHDEFLAEAGADPRRAFVETLLDATERTEYPIIVYSAYEKTQLRSLAVLFPDLADRLNQLIIRLADLLPVVRQGLYRQSFGFSSSIKAVAPALCSDVSYADLEEIADGTAASKAFWLLATGEVEADRSAELRAALLAYCKRDTWAMVRVHQALLAEAEDVGT